MLDGKLGLRDAVELLEGDGGVAVSLNDKKKHRKAVTWVKLYKIPLYLLTVLRIIDMTT